MAATPKITIIGGGIIGASIAWHLVDAGASVQLVTQTPGGVATPTSFGWINASWGNPEPYFRLRTRSMSEWRRLADEIPALPLAWGGGLCWDLPAENLLAYARDHGNWGYGIHKVTAEDAARIEPDIRHVPEFALHIREEGAAEPLSATMALIDNARLRGLDVIEGLQITGLREKSGRIAALLTADGEIEADNVVLAAGSTVPKLAATVGVTVPLDAPPGLLIHTKPMPPLLNGLVIAPELHLRQTRDGRIVAGSDFGGTDPGEDAQAAARKLFARTRGFLKSGDRLELDFHTVGYRPTPADGFPILGRAGNLEGLYIAVTHSGVTLAPAIGRFAAEEIMTGEPEALFAPYRLSRFA
jgi:glycine/D-amino acid oxidase-like deaminating enzyme